MWTEKIWRGELENLRNVENCEMKKGELKRGRVEGKELKKR